MRFVSEDISSGKTIAPFCSTSPPRTIFYTPTCHATLQSASQHADTLLLRHDSTIKNLIPEGNNRTSVWINVNSRLDGRYAREQKEIKRAFVAVTAIPKPTLKLSSSNPLRRLRLYLLFTFKQPSYYPGLKTRKPQGQRLNSRAGWGKVQLPKGHSCTDTSQSC